MTHPGVPGKDLAEFLAHARANPGKLNYGTPGNGTAPHIAGEVFSREAGIRMTHVPYKGAGPVLKDLLGGQIDLAFDSGTALPQAKRRQAAPARGGGLAPPRRFPRRADVRGSRLQGRRRRAALRFLCAAAHAAAGGRARFNREVTKLMQEAAIRERFEAQGLEVAPPMTPEAFAAYVRAESARYAKLLPEIGLTSK